jgi:hypothetical protein
MVLYEHQYDAVELFFYRESCTRMIVRVKFIRTGYSFI